LQHQRSIDLLSTVWPRANEFNGIAALHGPQRESRAAKANRRPEVAHTPGSNTMLALIRFTSTLIVLSIFQLNDEQIAAANSFSFLSAGNVHRIAASLRCSMNCCLVAAGS
jgi:hypothetical protein